MFNLKDVIERCKVLWGDDKGGNLYTYKNYEEYKEAQIAGNKRKIDAVWVQEENIELISKYLKSHFAGMRFGLCHGTRNGVEQQLFKKYLGIDILGTEISPTANDFPDTIEWDFHDVKPEWIDSVDFIYSNAFDHSYDPEKCLDAWMSCVKKTGCCILEWTPKHMVKSKTDPFAASAEEYKRLIENKYLVKDVLEGFPAGVERDQPTTLFVVTHKN